MPATTAPVQAAKIALVSVRLRQVSSVKSRSRASVELNA
jgi:hypothetical protein